MISLGRRPRISTAILSVAVGVSGLAVASPAGATTSNGPIVFVSGRSGNADVWRMDADGTDPEQLTSDVSDDVDPAPSPDGSEIAFISNRDGNGEIYLMDAAGSAQTRLTDTPENESQPTWSPDGTRLVFLRGTSSDIWTIGADGTSETQVTAEIDIDNSPVFSPDGTTIAFSRSSKIWTTDLDGENQTQITSGANDLEPAYLPDGRIVYRATNQVFVMEGYGTNPTNLSQDPVFAGQPAPSPDGQRVAFLSLRNTVGDLEFDIYVMDVDGSDQMNLTADFSNDYLPAWSAVPPTGSDPSTSFTSQPASVSNDATPTFGFEADEPSTFECSLVASGQPDAFSSCASPYEPAALSDGSYVFKVRATDVDLNVESPPRSVTFTIDTVVPSAAIDAPATTSDDTPSFSFSFDEPVSAACKVAPAAGSAAFESCSSPFTAPASLIDGPYVFTVAGTDPAGNVGTETLAFVIDATGPTASVTRPTLTSDNTPSFTVSFDEVTVAKLCSIHPASAVGSFGACDSPLHSATLADGDYVLEVKGTDALDNTGPVALHAFTIDTTPPVITVTALSKKTDRTPTFAFTAPDVAGGFTCAVDAGAFGPCLSPFTTAKLKPTAHTLRVRGSDAAGNETTKSFPFKIKRR